MNIIHTCRPKTGSITVSKFVTDHAEDATYFHVTLAGSAEEPTVVSGYVQQGTPITFGDLPFDTYTLVETAEPGYAAVLSDPVTISRGSRTASIEVVNVKMTAIKYGALYNWYAATDARNIANTGWHVQPKTELFTFQSYASYATGGGKLKKTGSDYWDAPNIGATDEYNFGSKGSGQRSLLGGFDLIAKRCSFWSISENTFNLNNSVCIYMVNSDDILPVSDINKKSGLSIRVIKDTPSVEDLAKADGEACDNYTGNDGKIYRTVKIGTQVWLADNLAETKFRTGELIPVVTDNSAWAALTTGAMCYYNNDINNA